MSPKSDDSSVASQLLFQIVNTAGGATTTGVIFITDDKSYNQVSLQIGLNSGTTELSAGTIPDPDSPPVNGTTIYLDLSALQLSKDCWNNMTFSGNWTFQKFAGEGVVGMTPKQTIRLESGTAGTIAIGIGGIVVPQPLRSSSLQLYTSYYGVPGVEGMYGTIPVALQARQDDNTKDLAEAISVSLSTTAGIVNSILPLLKATNLFSLQFVSRQNVQVVAGPDTLFTVTFVCGSAKDTYGFGALTDIGNAGQINARKGLNAAQWQVSKNSGAQSISWTLQPPDKAPIVGTGEQSVVAIDFSNIVTTYQPGPTVMLISYQGVPGYRPGTFVIVLNKVGHAVIRSLSVSPNPTCFSGGSADVTVKWTVDNAQSLELTQAFATNPVTGTEVPAVLNAERTAFALKATGAEGTVANVDYRTVIAIALPVINSFTGGPTEIFAGSLSHDATFAWAVDSTDDVTLTGTQGAFSGLQFSPLGSAPATIDQPQMITLAPTTAANPLTLTRRLVISAFDPVPTSHPLSFTPTAAAASPRGPFFVLAGPSGLTAVDTVQFAAAGTVSTGHPPASLAFSPDGTMLATANSDSTVSAIGVSLDGAGMPSFGAPSTVTLSAAPQQLVLSPKGPRIFVTVDPGGGAAGQVVSLVSSAGSYQVEGSVTVGKAPRGLAVDAAGSRLYVANSGDDTATMIGLTGAGALGGVVGTIQQLTGGPTGVAAAPSGKQLLVSCASAGTVVALDPNHPNTGQRQTLAVGRTPGQIAITPSGSYAFVANGGDGTLSLIDCYGLPSRAAVVGKPIAVGAQPTGVTVSADGLQVLVAMANAFSLVTLATRHVPTTAPSAPNWPDSVATTPDGSKVFVWHDAAVAPPSPAPGVLVFNLASGLPSDALASLNVLRCVVSPDPATKQAYAIVTDDAQLHTVATDTLEEAAVDLGLASGSKPVALAISGEGKTLFVVAADHSRNLSLVVLQLQDINWTATQTLSLYRATTPGRILLRATPDGTTLFLVDVATAQVRVLRQSGAGYTLSSTVIKSDLSALDVAVLPDGSTAYVLNAGQTNNSITVIDVKSLATRIAAIPQSYVNLRALQPSPDGRQLFATDSNAAALRVLDPQSLRILHTIPLASGPGGAAGTAGLAVSADGSSIFAANTVSKNLSIVEQIQMGTVAALARPPRPRLLRAARALDAPYSGLFMRHYLGETPGAPANGFAGSPDVIPYGKTIAPDLTIFTSRDGNNDGYNKDYGANVYLKNPNQIYIRGLNTTAAPITSRAYFYFTRGSLALWPANWSDKNVTVNNLPQNWVDITAPANGVGVGQLPIVWLPDGIDPATDHYCVIAWVDNNHPAQPPDFANYSKFSAFDDLVQFVINHHNLAWRNTYDIPSPPPGLLYNAPIPVPSYGGSVGVVVTFPNVPLDGTFAVNLQGTDSSNSIALPESKLSQFQGGYSPRNNPLVFTGGINTNLQVTHWPGPTPLPPTAKIKVTLSGLTPQALMRDVERMYRPMGLRTPFTRMGDFYYAIVGVMTFNLLFGGAGYPRERVR